MNEPSDESKILKLPRRDPDDLTAGQAVTVATALVVAAPVIPQRYRVAKLGSHRYPRGYSGWRAMVGIQGEAFPNG